MRSPALPAVLVLATLSAGCCAPDTEPGAEPVAVSTQVRTESGELSGVRDGEVVRFRGIPYAQPPTGDLRLAPPRPVRPWSTVRDATRSGPPCAQSGEPPQGSTEEDCLYLDVTVPADATTSARPVLVWLHGGGFSSGAGTEYDPARLAAQGDVVVVTVDFRLGVLGNLAVPGMTDGGTFGLQDQQAALRWLRHNAAAFGGDTGNITLFGQSGGAVAVCGQLTSPSAEGLFDKAILQSGSCATTLAANAFGPGSPALGTFWRPMADAERTGVTVADALGCTDRSTMLTCLRALPVDRLLTQSGSATAAAFGGETLPFDPIDALRRGDFSAMPVLSGHTAHEQRMAAGVFAFLGKPITEAAYPGLLTQGFGADATAVSAEYPISEYPSPALAWAAAYTDSGFVCPQLRTNAAISRRAPVYGYEFADTTAPPLIPVPADFDPGASHAADLFYLFDLPGKPLRLDGSTYSLTTAQHQVADTMITAWSAFARTGKPGDWPAWRGDSARVHQFTEDASHPRTTNPANSHHCGFWAEHTAVGTK